MKERILILDLSQCPLRKLVFCSEVAAANKLVFYLRNIIFTYLVICAVHGIINELISITVIINLSVKVFFSLCICIYAFFVFLDFLGSSLLFTRMAEKYNNKDYLIILASWDHLWHEIEHIRRNHLKYTPYTILDKVLFEIKEIYRYTRKNRVKENDISLDDFPEFDIEVIKPGVIF